jgi:hypothetical protein
LGLARIFSTEQRLRTLRLTAELCKPTALAPRILKCRLLFPMMKRSLQPLLLSFGPLLLEADELE